VSTCLYAALTSQRKAAPKGTSTRPDIARPEDPRAGKPGVTTWTDALAALVPAEVLAAQAFLLGFVTKVDTEPSVSSEPVTVFTNPDRAKVLFVVLLVASLLIYVFVNVGQWTGLDWLRMLIPPSAFFLWSVLQPGAAFADRKSVV